MPVTEKAPQTTNPKQLLGRDTWDFERADYQWISGGLKFEL